MSSSRPPSSGYLLAKHTNYDSIPFLKQMVPQPAPGHDRYLKPVATLKREITNRFISCSHIASVARVHGTLPGTHRSKQLQFSTQRGTLLVNASNTELFEPLHPLYIHLFSSSATCTTDASAEKIGAHSVEMNVGVEKSYCYLADNSCCGENPFLED